MHTSVIGTKAVRQGREDNCYEKQIDRGIACPAYAYLVYVLFGE
jgi:hypothetical protein